MENIRVCDDPLLNSRIVTLVTRSGEGCAVFIKIPDYPLYPHCHCYTVCVSVCVRVHVSAGVRACV